MQMLARIAASGLLLAGMVATTSPVAAGVITFQNLDIGPNVTVIEDGMRYTTRDNFIVRPFVGNPPSGLLGSPISNDTFNITRADNGDFTFDRYDFGSFAPRQQSDTWQFRGLLDGVQQYAFLDTTTSTFVTRTTGQTGIIDTLEISVVKASAAAGVADNFVFTSVPEPSSLAMLSIGGLIVLGFACHHMITRPYHTGGRRTKTSARITPAAMICKTASSVATP
jgi:hypothetical protein